MVDKKQEDPTLEEVIEKEKKDTTWKKPPAISREDGFLYRTNRVQNPNGTFTIIKVRVGDEPHGKKGS